MTSIIINVSKYIILILMALYTLSCFTAFRQDSEKMRDQKLNKQIIYVFLIHFLSYLTFALSNSEEMMGIVIFCNHIYVYISLYLSIFFQSHYE